MVNAKAGTSEEDNQPPPISQPGTYTLETVSIGCKIYVRRPVYGAEDEVRKAEILSIRDRPKSIYGEILAQQVHPADKFDYYIHWVDFNKRLDEWVAGSRLVLTRELEWPKPKPPPVVGKKEHTSKANAHRTNSLLKKATHGAAASAGSPAPSSLKRKAAFEESRDSQPDDGEGEETDGEVAKAVDPRKGPTVFSKEQEIEKLRHSGSMTQSVHEIARVKNLNRLQIGKHEVEAWYFSPYPVEYSHLPLIYICEFCLSYFPTPKMFSRHRQKCTLLHPPGNEIYRHEDISVFEIDGKRQLTWCRNLSLLSKCFLDHKTLYYDVQPFLYYIMTTRDDHGCHIIGYFSKEKESADSYNVACILTLPQHQRHGYGKLLIEFSYELSKREGKTGSPEKPLSDLGLLGYRAYWIETIVELLLTIPAGEDISVEEIAQKTSITPNDVQWTCQTFEMLKNYRNSHVIHLTDSIKERYEKTLKKRKRRIVPSALQWKPPSFTREQLRFGW
ncbi:hypothetical protein BOTBODRAFT_141906 [Botryobasidium botryosum FD-172 SS1]|uniref:histone acetyltransferase n=1 Tax=Botryobasidium botryosum (strain FD-172 SS1) TaxID=930990 RepID=A0A067NDN2_BOTB1|nr:hypothetical protein BOTBODRAFT_141906 [Botryobasidium botryosum FD-172 SS1]